MQAYSASLTIGDIPATPTNLVVTAISSAQVALQWQDNATNDSGYSVEELIDGNWESIAMLSADSTSATITSQSFSPSTEYHFRVRAYNDDDSPPTYSLASNLAPAMYLPPTVSVTDAGGTYNGSAYTAAATVTGINGTSGTSLEGVGLTLTYYQGSLTAGQIAGPRRWVCAPVTPGTYTAVASFARQQRLRRRERRDDLHHQPGDRIDLSGGIPSIR